MRNNLLVVFESSQLFMISGGPGAGKTTLITELSRLGHAIAPEIARQIIQEQVQSGGSALPWADREAFAHLMLERSIESYLQYATQGGLVFSDRGIPDVLCYARLIGMRDELAMQEACRRYRYVPLVFLAPPWKEIYVTDDERKQGFPEAVRTYEKMATVYEEYGYKTIELPRTTPRARADFVLEKIQLAS